MRNENSGGTRGSRRRHHEPDPRGSAGRTGRLLLVAYRRAGFGGKQALRFPVVRFGGVFVRNVLRKVLMPQITVQYYGCVYTMGCMTDSTAFTSDRTRVSEEAASAVQVVKRKGRVGFTHINPFDMEVLRLALAAKYVRAVQVAGWTGAGMSHVQDRLRVLQGFGFVEPMLVSCNFPDVVGGPKPWRPHTVKVFRITGAGARVVGAWSVAGTATGYVTSPSPARPQNTLGNHTLSALDVGIVFRRLGFGVAFEREYKAVEIRANTRGGGSAVVGPVWCTPLASGGLHAPDLGVVHPDGSGWRVEIELTPKKVADYVPVIRSLYETGEGQLWLADSEAVIANVGAACAQLGIVLGEYDLGPGVPPVFADDSFRVRVQRFRGGFPLPKRLSAVQGLWGDLVAAGVPGGFGDVSPVDVSVLRSSWAVRG